MLYHMLYSFTTYAIYHAIYHLCYQPSYIICYIGLPPMLSTMLYTTYAFYHVIYHVIWNLPPQLPWQKFYPLCLVQAWEDPSRESLTQHCRSPTDPSWALLEQGRCHHLKGVSLAYLGQFHSLHSPCDPPGPLAVALAVELGLAAGAELALPKHKKSQFISVCKCRPPVILKLIHFIC